MLTATKTTTMLPVEDADRAGRFYADMLGLKPVTTAPDGTRIFVLQDVGPVVVYDTRPVNRAFRTFPVAPMPRER